MKIKYSIKEVAELFNITINKIRFYEKKGLITAARDEQIDEFNFVVKVA